ncbi:MAG: glycosyltransferase [Nitrospira sp.]|nr:MAG: glycosyltransferase [Nitrospira sp.]
MSSSLTFSIVIPTYRRPSQLGDCLAALTGLDFAREQFEVIVVDDGSGNPPSDLVASFRNRLEITLTSQTHGGPGAARNTGAQMARGRYLALTDDDCLVTPHWLSALQARLNHMPQALVGGRTINAYPDNLYSTVSQRLTDSLYAYYDSHPRSLRFFTSNNLAVARSMFLEVGGFDPTFPLAAGEDREFCARWVRHGHMLVSEDRAVIHHRHWLTMRSFWKQQFWYGRGAYRFHQACVRGRQEGHKVGRDFLGHVIRTCFRTSGLRNGCLAATLMAASQAAIVAGMAAESLLDRKSA